MNGMNDNDASIGVGSRFQRIEQALTRIEEKLDLKANATELSRADNRIGALENRVILLESTLRADQAVDAALQTQQANAVKLTRVIVGMIVTAIVTLGGLAVQIIVAARHW